MNSMEEILVLFCGFVVRRLVLYIPLASRRGFRGPVSVPEAGTTSCISQSNPIGSKDAIRCLFSFAVPNLRPSFRARLTL